MWWFSYWAMVEQTYQFSYIFLFCLCLWRRNIDKRTFSCIDYIFLLFEKVNIFFWVSRQNWGEEVGITWIWKWWKKESKSHLDGSLKELGVRYQRYQQNQCPFENKNPLTANGRSGDGKIWIQPKLVAIITKPLKLY